MREDGWAVDGAAAEIFGQYPGAASGRQRHPTGCAAACELARDIHGTVADADDHDAQSAQAEGVVRVLVRRRMYDLTGESSILVERREKRSVMMTACDHQGVKLLLSALGRVEFQAVSALWSWLANADAVAQANVSGEVKVRCVIGEVPGQVRVVREVAQLLWEGKIGELGSYRGRVDVERIINAPVGVRRLLHPQSTDVPMLLEARRVEPMLEQDFQSDEPTAPGSQHGDAGPLLGQGGVPRALGGK